MTIGDDFQDIVKLYDDYVSHRCQESLTFQIWSSHNEMVNIVNRFIRAMRETDWKAHMTS